MLDLLKAFIEPSGLDQRLDKIGEDIVVVRRCARGTPVETDGLG
jgi:hypothetical protein